MMTFKKGDICKTGSSKCLAYYSAFSNGMRFGFGASELDKTILRSIWWANWDEAPIEESWKRFVES